MIVVHKGFDTIILSIQANISQKLFKALDVERERAEETREARPFTYGGADFDLLPYGGNGYRFILKGGPLQVQWFFKKPNPRDPWGIRVSVGSTLLATQGLGRARAYIDQTMKRLGVKFAGHQVSIARADFCVDILAPDFELVPENFVTHSHTNRADHLAPTEHVQSNGKSGRFTSVTIGKMPGRQVIVYDKRREIIDKHKPIWWEIWNSNLAIEGLPELDPKEKAASRVWRVEIRAGKKLLKDRWKIRRWTEFDDLFGDVISEALQKIRYCDLGASDTNRSRWTNHEIWDLVVRAADNDMFEMRSFLAPDMIKAVHREEQIRLMEAQSLGNLVTLAALEGVEQAKLPKFFKTKARCLSRTALQDRARVQEKLAAAKARYRFV